MESLKSPKKCSIPAELSNLINQELEAILVTNFQQRGPKSVSYMYTLSVSVAECVVVVVVTWCVVVVL